MRPCREPTKGWRRFQDQRSGTGSQRICDDGRRTRHGTNGFLGHDLVPRVQRRPCDRWPRLNPDGCLVRVLYAQPLAEKTS